MAVDSIVGLTTCLPLAHLVHYDNAATILLSMLAGMMMFAFSYAYYRTLAIADVSSTAAYIQLLPVFAGVFGFLLFGERFTSSVYIGIGLVVCGVWLVSVRSGMSLRPSGANARALLVFILPGVALLSLKYALQKHLLASATVWDVYFWGRIGCFCASVAVLCVSRSVAREVRQSITVATPRTLVSVGVVEWMDFCGIIAIIGAYSVGTITLVTTVSAIQPLLVVGLSLAVGALGRGTTLSDFSSSRRVLALRVLGIVGQIVGLYLIWRPT